MSDLDDILSDAHVAPSFKRALTTPHEFLIKVHAKQERRRFLQEPEVPSAFIPFEPNAPANSTDAVWLRSGNGSGW